jgi:PAS domain S-box-containing protein
MPPSSPASAAPQAQGDPLPTTADFRLLVEHASDLIWHMNADGIFTYVSPSWEHILGYRPAELMGASFQPLVHPDDLPACLAYFRQMVQSQAAAPTPQYRVRHADGSWHWHEGITTPVPEAAGQGGSLVGITRDITERKAAEEALRASEERYHLIDEASQDLIYSYDRQGRFTHANTALCRRLGLAREQILGQTHEALGFPPEQCREWTRLHEQVYQTNATVIAETITPIQGSEPQYFEVVLNPIHNEAGAIIGIAGTTRDINARKQADIRLKEQLAELRRWHTLTLGREERILELKREVNQLLAEAGQPPRYPSATAPAADASPADPPAQA